MKVADKINETTSCVSMSYHNGIVVPNNIMIAVIFIGVLFLIIESTILSDLFPCEVW